MLKVYKISQALPGTEGCFYEMTLEIRDPAEYASRPYYVLGPQEIRPGGLAEALVAACGVKSIDLCAVKFTEAEAREWDKWAAARKRTDLYTQYECGRCDELHFDEESAVNCCARVEEVYVCPECDEVYTEDIKEAEACHKTHMAEESRSVPRAELQALGQKTLFLC